jgi:hypothetical protein
MVGLFSCALDACDMFLLWHCREAETMRAGATALSGMGPTKLMLANERSAENERGDVTIRERYTDDLDVDGVWMNFLSVSPLRPMTREKALASASGRDF